MKKTLLSTLIKLFISTKLRVTIGNVHTAYAFLGYDLACIYKEMLEMPLKANN